MNRKWIAIGLIMFLANIYVEESAWAQTGSKSDMDLKRVKVHVLTYGRPDGPRVDVKLRDKTRLKGQISQAGGSTFGVVDSKSGKIVTVNYSDVKTVSKPMSKWVKIPILVVVGLIAVAAVGSAAEAASN